MISQREINRLDKKFEEQLRSIKYSFKETEFTLGKKAERRIKADADDFEFCKIYYPNIFNDGWNDLHYYIRDAVTGPHSVSGSRFFGKTAFTYVAKIIKSIALGGSGMIGLGLRTQDIAKERTRSIVRLIKNNKLLMYDYDIKVQQDRAGSYIINNKTFVAFGYREGLRNFFDEEFKRFDIIVLDDLYNAQTVSSTVDNEKILRFVESECTGQLNPNGLLIWLFNYITVTSPGYLYADKNPKNHFNLPALNNKDRTNWKESRVWTTKKLQQKRTELPFEVWMGDWMNKPLQKGEEFEIEWIRSININSIEIISSISVADPSHGQSPQACYKSIITMSYTNTSKYLIQDIYLRKEPYESFFDYAYNLSLEIPKWKTLLFEDDFGQWSIAKPFFDNWKKKTKNRLAIQKFTSKSLKTKYYAADKESRIRNLILPFQTAEIIFNNKIISGKNPDYDLWFAQYLAFGKHKEKLDGLDATASAYILFPRYLLSGNFKPIKNRFTKKQSWLVNR